MYTYNQLFLIRLLHMSESNKRKKIKERRLYTMVTLTENLYSKEFGLTVSGFKKD